MQNFVIVGTPRTGSTLLQELLTLHPHVVCGWQWTAQLPRREKIAAARQALGGDFSPLPPEHQAHMAESFGVDTGWLGFRAMFRASDKWFVHPRLAPALWVDALEAHIRWLASRPDIRVVHITRGDNMAWLKSYLLSRMTKIYVDRPYPEGLIVRMSKRQAIARVRSKRWLDGRLASLARSNPYCRVHYETLSQDKAGVGAKTLRFLGCDPKDYRPDEDALPPRQARRATPDGMEDYVELVRALSRRDLLRDDSSD